MAKTCKIIGLFLLIAAFTSICSAADEKVQVSTYFPAPVLKYDQLTTDKLLSQSTIVTGEFKKEITGSNYPLRVGNTATPTGSYPPGSTYTNFISTPVYFSLFDQNKSIRVIPPPGSTAATMSFNTYNLNVNAIRDLNSLNVGGNIIDSWPGPGQCTDFSSFFVFSYTAACPDNSYLTGVWETPGFYLGAGVGGGYACGALGLGGGVKMAVVNYRCCKIAGTDASLSGSTTPSPCQAQYDNYNAKNTAWKNAQLNIVAKFDQMRSAGCCNSLPIITEAIPDTNGQSVGCGYDPTLAQCPPLWNQYQNLKAIRDPLYPPVNTAKQQLCNCICSGDPTCYNACLSGS